MVHVERALKSIIVYTALQKNQKKTFHKTDSFFQLQRKKKNKHNDTNTNPTNTTNFPKNHPLRNRIPIPAKTCQSHTHNIPQKHPDRKG
jgi:hypothetical protein